MSERIIDKEISLPELLLLFLAAAEIPAGFMLDVSVPALITYVAFVLVLFFTKTESSLTYVWYLIMSALTVVGVFACETTPAGLYEISKVGHYVNATAVISLMYMLFFIVLFSGIKAKLPKKGRYKDRLLGPYSLIIARVVLVAALVIEVYLILNVYDRPYFNLGIERYRYLTEQLSSFGQAAKSWLPVFIPCAVIVYKSGNKALPVLFFAAMLFIYIWTGDKFGTYLFALSVLLFCVVGDFGATSRVFLRRLFAVLLIGAIALFFVGYAQRFLLYGADIPEYIEFLLLRLAEQGQVWWSVFDHVMRNGVYLNDLPNGLLACYSNSVSMSYPYAGQWKMMLVASDYSSYTIGRIEAGVAYTTTTQATLFYYFGWLAIAFYPPLALLCRKLITHLHCAAQDGDCLISMLFVKLVIAFNALLTSSEISAFLSPVTIAILILLFVLTRRGGAGLAWGAIKNEAN